MYFKTFNKLEKNEKIEILSELGLLYDLSTEKGENALKKEFKHIKPAVKKIMIQKGLYGGVKQWLLNLMKMLN